MIDDVEFVTESKNAENAVSCCLAKMTLLDEVKIALEIIKTGTIPYY